MEAIQRHDRIAFQLSGGKDSVAALFLLKPFWNRFTVYFCDSGDSLPETYSIICRLAAILPRFQLIPGRVAETKARWGQPTDLLPWTSAYAAHHHNAGETPLMQDRVACCSRSIMAPLHDWMIADEITLIIRGQKDADDLKGPLKSGDVVDGIEYLFPVQGWADEECFSFMRDNGIEPQRFYAEGMKQSADCATCTSWNGDDRAKYLKQYHPDKFQEYQRNMHVIAGAIAPALDNFRKELEACHG